MKEGTEKNQVFSVSDLGNVKLDHVGGKEELHYERGGFIERGLIMKKDRFCLKRSFLEFVLSITQKLLQIPQQVLLLQQIEELLPDFHRVLPVW